MPKAANMSMHEGRLARIERKSIARAHIDAYIVAATEELVLLQPVRDRIDLDGYDVIRAADISRVSASPKSHFYEEALALKRMRPKKPKAVVLDDIKALLASLRVAYPLVVIHRERVAPDSCEIGRVRALSASTYRLSWISPTAVFEEDGRRFKLSDITMVQFDGAYENTLAAVAAERLVDDRELGSEAARRCLSIAKTQRARPARRARAR